MRSWGHIAYDWGADTREDGSQSAKPVCLWQTSICLQRSINCLWRSKRTPTYKSVVNRVGSVNHSWAVGDLRTSFTVWHPTAVITMVMATALAVAVAAVELQKSRFLINPRASELRLGDGSDKAHVINEREDEGEQLNRQWNNVYWLVLRLIARRGGVPAARKCLHFETFISFSLTQLTTCRVHLCVCVCIGVSKKIIPINCSASKHQLIINSEWNCEEGETNTRIAPT